MSMEERRHFVRLDTRLEINYSVLPSGGSQHSSTKNISKGGICLFAEQPMVPGTRLQVAMILPGREQPVNFTADVVWCEQYEVISKTERRRSVELGVQFVEISPQDQDAVMQHIILRLQPIGR